MTEVSTTKQCLGESCFVETSKCPLQVLSCLISGMHLQVQQRQEEANFSGFLLSKLSNVAEHEMHAELCSHEMLLRKGVENLQFEIVGRMRLKHPGIVLDSIAQGF